MTSRATRVRCNRRHTSSECGVEWQQAFPNVTLKRMEALSDTLLDWSRTGPWISPWSMTYTRAARSFAAPSAPNRWSSSRARRTCAAQAAESSSRCCKARSRASVLAPWPARLVEPPLRVNRLDTLESTAASLDGGGDAGVACFAGRVMSGLRRFAPRPHTAAR
jgi:hypothetical protein